MGLSVMWYCGALYHSGVPMVNEKCPSSRRLP